MHAAIKRSLYSGGHYGQESEEGEEGNEERSEEDCEEDEEGCQEEEVNLLLKLPAASCRRRHKGLHGGLLLEANLNAGSG
jgi:hypothetical protein